MDYTKKQFCLERFKCLIRHYMSFEPFLYAMILNKTIETRNT